MTSQVLAKTAVLNHFFVVVVVVDVGVWRELPCSFLRSDNVIDYAFASLDLKICPRVLSPNCERVFTNNRIQKKKITKQNQYFCYFFRIARQISLLPFLNIHKFITL